MNRTALLFILGLSVAGNALLGYLVVRGSSRPVSDDAAASADSSRKPLAAAAKAEPAANLAAATELTKKLAAPRTVENLREIAAQLRASGFSGALVRMVMQSLVDEELMRRQNEIFDWSAVPYWQEQRPTPEQMKAIRGFQKERRALMADLNLPLSPREEAGRRRQFGNLPDAKIAALEKIQQDYNELRQEMFESPRGGSGGRDLAAQQRLLQEEQERDIAALLSPEEKIEYELRNSSTANQVRSQLRGIAVNEQEFRDLFVAQKAFEAANPRQPGAAPTPEQREAGLGAWDAYQAAARGSLGEERYRQFLLSSQLENPNAKNFFTERPGITTEQIQAMARLSRTTGIELSREFAVAGLSNDERRARLDALAARAQAQATQILGPQLAKEAEAARLLPGPRNGNSSGSVIRLPGGG